MGRGCTEESSLAITTQRFLQNTSQLGITIGNVATFAFGQSMNTITQCRQRLINLLGFIQGLAFGTSLVHFFRTS